MRNVNKTTCKISGIGSLHSGIRKTLTGTVGRDEVLEHAHTFLEVRKNRVLNNLSTFSSCLLRFCHKSTHTGQLTNLVFRTTGSRVKHHVDGVESLVSLSHLLHQDVTQLVIYVCPGVNYLVVTLVVCDESHVIVVGNLTHFLITFCNEVGLLLRNDDIVKVERQTSQICHTITKVLDTVEELAGTGKAHSLNYVGNNIAKTLLRDNLIYITNFFRYDAVDNHTADRSLNHLVDKFSVCIKVFHNNLYLSMEVTLAFIVRNDSLFRTIERKSLTLCTRTNLCNIVKSEHHIL